MAEAMIAARLVQFAAAMLVLGAACFRLAVAPALAAPGTRGVFDRWLLRTLLAAAVLVLLSSLVWLDLEAVAMGGGWADAIDGQTLAAVLLKTEFGRAWIVHIALAGLLVAALLAAPARQATAAICVAACLAAGLVASLAWAGHAVMETGTLRAVHLANQVVHLVAGSLWLGSLPPLGYVLGQARRDPGPWARAARSVLLRYSRLGYLAVGLILLTGCVNSWLLVGSIHALVATTYGLVLVTKVGLVLLMIALAMVNRFGLVPRIMRVEPGRAEAPLAMLARSVAVEQAFGLAVLVAVSVLGTLPPALIR